MNPNNDLWEDLVTWKRKSDREDDPYIKFFILYMIFNAWLSAEVQLCGIDARTDRQKLDWLKRSNSGLTLYWSKCDLDSELCQDLLELKFVRNMRNGGHVENNDLQHIGDLYNFNKIVEFVYQVRNNLFHGSKPYHLEGRNHRLVRSSSEILNIWIEYVLASGRRS